MSKNQDFRTAEEDKVLAETQAAIERGDDPFGDNEPLVVLDNDHQLETQGAAANPPGENNDANDDLDDDTTAAAPAAPPADDAAAAPAAAPAPVEAPAAPAPEPAPAPPPAAAPAPVVQYNVGDPAKLDEQLAALDTRQSEAFAKLMDGEIDQAEYQKVYAEVRAAERDILSKKTLHEANVQREVAEQHAVYESIAKQGANDGIDYAKDGKAQAQFDASLRIEAQDPANAGKSFADLANLAHQAVLAMRGIAKTSAPTPAPAPAAAAPAAAPAAPRTAPTPPPTLHGLPAASTANTGGGMGEQLSRLKGLDFQEAIGKMSKAQRDAYLDS